MISDGKLSISRSSGSGVREDYVIVALKTATGLELRAEVDLKEFALAVTGRSEQTCVVSVRER